MAEQRCEGCDEPLTRGQQRFCSRRCLGRANLSPGRGAENPRYNGGLCFNKALRRWVIVGTDYSLTLYSRAVMAAELGRPLRADEIVHHKNEDTTDDRIENLEILTRAAHIELHRDKLMDGRRAAAARRAAA